MKNSNTNKNHYVTFVVVYETMNYNRAAEILGISRQAVSQNLKELGNQLGGIKLFIHDPVNRCVTPSSEATAMYPDVKESVEKMMEVEEGLQAFTSESKAVIRLAIPSAHTSHYFNKYIIDFCKKYPKVCLEFYAKESMDLLAQKKIDLVVNAKNSFRDYNFQIVDLFKEEYIFVATSEFLAQSKLKPDLTVQELLSVPTVAQQDSLKSFKMASGIDLSPSVITVSTEQVFATVKGGLGIGLYWNSAFSGRKCKACCLLQGNQGDCPTKDEIIKLNIKDTRVFEPLACAYNKGHLTKAAKAFLDGLLSYCKNNNNV